MTRYAVRLTVAVLVATTVGLGVPGTAQASTCSSSKGVTVVVDFNGLGGGVQTACDLGGAGHNADQQLREVGHTLDYVHSQPGFICRIDGSPQNDPCTNTPPSNAYWSLWWSDGKSGTWQYSSTSAGGLTVPAGGSVGMSWQGSSSKSPPSATPPRNASSPSPSPSPSPSTRPSSSPHPSSHPSHAASSSAAAPTPSASADASAASHGTKGAKAHPTKHPSKHATPSASASQGGDSTDAASPLAGVTTGGPGDSGGGSGGGLPGWVAPVAIAVLFLGSGIVVLARRRHGAGT